MGAGVSLGVGNWGVKTKTSFDWLVVFEAPSGASIVEAGASDACALGDSSGPGDSVGLAAGVVGLALT
jgi:hypothetical protein